MVGGPEGPEETRGSIVARSHTQQDSCELQVAASWAVRVSLPLKTPTVKKCAEGREAQQRLGLDQFVLENSIPKSQVTSHKLHYCVLEPSIHVKSWVLSGGL